jgi:hypothetical protein
MRPVLIGPLLVSLWALPSYGAVSLSAGTYGMYTYVTKVAITGKGTCDYHVGEQFSEFFIYPGPNRTGASKRDLIQTSTDHFVAIDTLPKTPAAGATSWSGTYHYSFLPGSETGTGTFTWKFTIIDATSFVATRTFSSDFTGGSCTVTFDESAVRTGS